MNAMAKRKPTMKPWPDRLKALRAKHRVTQAEAAKRICISQSQWAAFEGGKRKPTKPIGCLIRLWERDELPENHDD